MVKERWVNKKNDGMIHGSRRRSKKKGKRERRRDGVRGLEQVNRGERLHLRS